MSGVSFSSLCLLAACSGTLVSATVHHLFVGSVEGVALVYGLEFDDKASTLKLAKSNAVEAAHPWITLGVSCGWSDPINLIHITHNE